MSGALSWASVLAWRMCRQHLARRAATSAMLDVVSDIAGAHAQLMSSAELTIWARVESLERGAVDSALWEERSLVKTWAMRGTLHLLPARELPLWVAAQRALKPRHESASWLRYFELTRLEAETLLAAIPQALEGRILTRDELAREVARLTGADHLAGKLRESWGALLKPAAFRGDLCFAPSKGRNVRFARPQEWLGTWDEVPTDTAVGDVVRRYLGAYGPASREDFGRWFGTSTPAEAGRLIATIGDETSLVDVEGTSAWVLADHVEQLATAAASGTVRLLPAFDHYVVAAPRDRDEVLSSSHKRRVYRPQGWLSPVMLVDGRVAGSGITRRSAAAWRSASSPSGRRVSRSGRQRRRRHSGWPAISEASLRSAGLHLPERVDGTGCGRRSSCDQRWSSLHAAVRPPEPDPPDEREVITHPVYDGITVAYGDVDEEPSPKVGKGLASEVVSARAELLGSPSVHRVTGIYGFVAVKDRAQCGEGGPLLDLKVSLVHPSLRTRWFRDLVPIYGRQHRTPEAGQHQKRLSRPVHTGGSRQIDDPHTRQHDRPLLVADAGWSRFAQGESCRSDGPVWALERPDDLHGMPSPRAVEVSVL